MLKLIEDPREIARAIHNSTASLTWRNEGGKFVGPYAVLLERHVFQPVAVATKKQLRRGRSK